MEWPNAWNEYFSEDTLYIFLISCHFANSVQNVEYCLFYKTVTTLNETWFYKTWIIQRCLHKIHEAALQNCSCRLKGVLYSMLGPDLLGLTVAVGNIVGRCLPISGAIGLILLIHSLSSYPWIFRILYCCWMRALNVNFSIFCALLYHTSLRDSHWVLRGPQRIWESISHTFTPSTQNESSHFPH